jgi:hypothetical protein
MVSNLFIYFMSKYLYFNFKKKKKPSIYINNKRTINVLRMLQNVQKFLTQGREREREISNSVGYRAKGVIDLLRGDN